MAGWFSWLRFEVLFIASFLAGSFVWITLVTAVIDYCDRQLGAYRRAIRARRGNPA